MALQVKKMNYRSGLGVAVREDHCARTCIGPLQRYWYDIVETSGDSFRLVSSGMGLPMCAVDRATDLKISEGYVFSYRPSEDFIEVDLHRINSHTDQDGEFIVSLEEIYWDVWIKDDVRGQMREVVSRN